jgi:hypothetical protein
MTRGLAKIMYNLFILAKVDQSKASKGPAGTGLFILQIHQFNVQF